VRSYGRQKLEKREVKAKTCGSISAKRGTKGTGRKNAEQGSTERTKRPFRVSQTSDRRELASRKNHTRTREVKVPE